MIVFQIPIIENLGNINFSPILSAAGWIISGVFYVFFFAALLYVIRRFLQFKYRVTIHDMAGLEKYDRAREVKTKKGIVYLQLFKERAVIPMVDNKYFGLTPRGKKTLHLYQYSSKGFRVSLKRKRELTDEEKEKLTHAGFIPINYKKKVKRVEFDPQETDMINIHTQISRESVDRYRKGSVWDRYIVPTLPIMSIGMIIVLFIIALDRYDNIQGAAGTVSQAMTNAVDAFNACKVAP